MWYSFMFYGSPVLLIKIWVFYFISNTWWLWTLQISLQILPLKVTVKNMNYGEAVEDTMCDSSNEDWVPLKDMQKEKLQMLPTPIIIIQIILIIW